MSTSRSRVCPSTFTSSDVATMVYALKLKTASSAALVTAASAPTVPASPQPFMPMTLAVDGVPS
jgi:hypothetical protein